MDPLTVFPPEIIHQIWRHLEPADLLAARAVAPHWLASVGDCPGAWVTDFSHDWTEFLAFKKAVRSWSSDNIRRRTTRNVKDCVFTEFAYYVLYGDGTLKMFKPNGDSVRTFHQPVTDLHRGGKCLLLGVDEPTGTTGHSRTQYRTIITDFVFNYIDDMLDTRITASSPNGYSCERNGECFFAIGPEIPGVEIPCPPLARMHFFASCAVSVQGFTVKTVRCFNNETKAFTNLKTLASSPRCIPKVEIVPGPADYFCIIADQREFNTISLYHRDTMVFEDSYPSSIKCAIITEDYLVVSNLNQVTTAFKLSDCTKQYQLDLPLNYIIKSTKCESWSPVKNIFAVSCVNSPGTLDWVVYRLSETQHKSDITEVDLHASKDAELKPKLQLLAANSHFETFADERWTIWGCDFFPGYAFKVLSTPLDARLVHFLYFVL